MGRLFTPLCRSTVSPAVGHHLPPTLSATDQAPELPDGWLRRMLRPLLVLTAAVIVQGCSASYGTVVRQYREAPSCCVSLAELPVEPLQVGDKKSFKLGEGSPAYRFDTGKSYFRAFTLPQGPYPYRVTVSSFLVGDDLKSAYLFFPQLLILDGNRTVVRSPEPATFSPARADLLDAMRESGGLRFKLEGGLSFTGEKGEERYLVVMTTDELLQERTSISAAGEVPMLGFSGTVSKEVRVPHAPGGRVTVSLSPLPPETAAGTKSAPVGAEAKVPASPEFVTVRLAGGTAIGAVELGRTTVEAARRLFEAGGAGLGQERENAATFNAGTTHLAPKRLYTPPGTLHQLYFDDNGVLVLIVDGSPAGLPPTGREFLQRFAGARESGRTMGSYELQAPLARCVTLMAVFRAVGDTLDSAAHAYGCPTR